MDHGWILTVLGKFRSLMLLILMSIISIMVLRRHWAVFYLLPIIFKLFRYIINLMNGLYLTYILLWPVNLCLSLKIICEELLKTKISIIYLYIYIYIAPTYLGIYIIKQ